MLVLLADDHAVVRRGLRQILSDAFPGSQFVEAGTGAEVLSHIAKQKCSVLLLDVNMPGRSGLEVLKDVKRSCPDLPVIVLSVQPEDQYAVRCLRAGASGFLNKDAAPEELVNAIKKALTGRRYVSSQLADKLASEIAQPSIESPHQQLSDRELDVMKMIARGTPLTAIAKELCVSVKTVSTYRSRILLKMRMDSNADLTRYALGHKLIE